MDDISSWVIQEKRDGFSSYSLYARLREEGVDAAQAKEKLKAPKNLSFRDMLVWHDFVWPAVVSFLCVFAYMVGFIWLGFHFSWYWSVGAVLGFCLLVYSYVKKDVFVITQVLYFVSLLFLLFFGVLYLTFDRELLLFVLLLCSVCLGWIFVRSRHEFVLDNKQFFRQIATLLCTLPAFFIMVKLPVGFLGSAQHAVNQSSSTFTGLSFLGNVQSLDATRFVDVLLHEWVVVLGGFAVLFFSVYIPAKKYLLLRGIHKRLYLFLVFEIIGVYLFASMIVYLAFGM